MSRSNVETPILAANSTQYPLAEAFFNFYVSNLSDTGEKHPKWFQSIGEDYPTGKNFLRDTPRLQLVVRHIYMYVIMLILSINNNKGPGSK